MKLGNGVLYFSPGLAGEADVMWKDEYGNEHWLGTFRDRRGAKPAFEPDEEPDDSPPWE